MKKESFFLVVCVLMVGFVQLGMASKGQYDEEAREAERLEKQTRKTERHINPAANMAGGLKQATVTNTTDVIRETAEATAEEPPIVGTLEGARRSTGKLLDNTVKGAVKVATLGYGEAGNYEVEEPEAANSEDTTKIRIKIPGT